MTPAEALKIARDAEPDAALLPIGATEAPHVGTVVTIGTEGHAPHAPDAVTGRVIKATARRVVLERFDEQLGRLAVHFPRLGYECYERTAVA